MQYRSNDGAKRMYTAYIGTCAVLYACHALFFTTGSVHTVDSLWTLCSLSVYPLFYGYICKLTSADYRVRQLVPWLVPGVVVALAKGVFNVGGLDVLRAIFFALQVIFVCYMGCRRLNAFDRDIQSVYADIEGRDTTAVHHLLVAVVAGSVLAGVANAIGRDFFDDSLWLLGMVSLAFSSMLYALSYICYNRKFTVREFSIDAEEPAEVKAVEEPADVLGRRLEMVLVGRELYLKKNLKIADVVREVKSNRTYVSNYINETYDCSFSDYINQLRIERVKIIMRESADKKLATIADEAGFSSEQSFYRNFQKFVGMSPREWMSIHST